MNSPELTNDYSVKVKIVYQGKELGCYSLTPELTKEILDGGEIYGSIGGYDAEINAFTRGMFHKEKAISYPKSDFTCE